MSSAHAGSAKNRAATLSPVPPHAAASSVAGSTRNGAVVSPTAAHRPTSAASRARTAATTATAAAGGGGGGAASSAASAVFRPRVAAGRGTTFLRDAESAEHVLPMPLPKGMPFAAAFTSFEDLVSREILVQPEGRRVYLSAQDTRIIFEAKCADQALRPCWERELRFLELVSANCQGMLFALRENGLGHHSAAAVAHVLARNVHFALLDLSGNKLASEGGFEVARMLETNTSLVHLNLRSNDMGPEAVGAIADALTRNNTVTSLDLGGISGVSRNHVGTFGARAIGEMLKVNRVLCMLGVSSSGLGAEGVRLIADGLNENLTLTYVDLSNNNIGHVGCQRLCDVIDKSSLVRLDLSGNGIGDRGAKFVARAYKLGSQGCTALTRLVLDGNGIGPAGASELARMVQTNPALQVLSLNNNIIAEGVVELADKLRDNRALKELYLASCGISEEGAVALASSLSKGCVLERLDLSKNRTGDSGARAFAAHLANKNERNPTLTKLKFLDLTGSAIGNDGGLDLARMVSENSTLAELVLRQNLIGGDVGMAFDEAFKKSDCRFQPGGNQTLLSLDLSFNDVPFHAHSKIEASLSRNRLRHKDGTVPRLKKEIEELEELQSDLFSKESEIESERRSNRDKTEEIARRRDMSRSQSDANRRQVAELTEEVQAAQAVHAAKKEEVRGVEERLNGERTKLVGRLTHWNHKVEFEREKRERVVKEIDRCRKQMQKRVEADDEHLRPVQEQFRQQDEARVRARTECRSVAELLAQVQMDILRATMKHAGVLPAPAAMVGKAPVEVHAAPPPAPAPAPAAAQAAPRGGSAVAAAATVAGATDPAADAAGTSARRARPSSKPGAKAAASAPAAAAAPKPAAKPAPKAAAKPTAAR